MVYVSEPGKAGRPLRGNKVFGWTLTREEEAARNKVDTPAAPLDAQSLAVQIAQGVAGALAPLLHQQQTQPNMIEMMTAMAGLMKAVAPPPAPSSDPFAIMNATLGIMKTAQEMQPDREPIERGGNAGTADVLLGMINKFGPAFSAVLSQQPGAMPMQQALPQPTGQVVQIPDMSNNSANTVAITQQEPAVTLQTQEQQALNELKTGLAFLKSAAMRDCDPFDYVPLVFDNVPDELLDMWLADPDPIPKLAAIDSGLNDPKIRDWFARLLEAVKTEFADDPTDIAAQQMATSNVTAVPAG
jgi:hypothetical protein